ncbi:MAG: FMN-binding glutamate synthase family protein [Candidatus Nealsonbacteria bacterium]|nr:FMN-binding glutamate synthase family protein [Candidatus Nealsonbacteria bacterium]
MNENWFRKIQDRVKNIPIASGRSNKQDKISFEDLVFMPAQIAKKPVDYYKEEIKTKTILGRLSKRPIEIEIPIIIGAMSFGALSREAKIALAKASSLAGTIENTGEGGMLAEEREFSKKLIIQYGTGRFGITEEILKKADAIEIKIGQGAKPGFGGYLPGTKVTEEIAQMRGVEKNKDIHSPAYHSDIKDIKGLTKKIEWLRTLTKGAPIILKLGAGDVEKDISLAIKANPDIIALDGMEGGTGAAPEVMLNEMGVPTLAALARAREILNKKRAKQELWIGGGFNTGADFAKALALGADAVFIGFPLLIALGCIYCRLCYLGKCPQGIATQEPELRKRLNVVQASQNIAAYLRNCNEEIKMITGAVGKNNVHQLSKQDLRALSLLSAKITGIKLV